MSTAEPAIGQGDPRHSLVEQFLKRTNWFEVEVLKTFDFFHSCRKFGMLTKYSGCNSSNDNPGMDTIVTFVVELTLLGLFVNVLANKDIGPHRRIITNKTINMIGKRTFIVKLTTSFLGRDSMIFAAS